MFLTKSGGGGLENILLTKRGRKLGQQFQSITGCIGIGGSHSVFIMNTANCNNIVMAKRKMKKQASVRHE